MYDMFCQGTTMFHNIVMVSVSNGSRFGPETFFVSVPEPFKNRTRSVLACRTRTSTPQPTGFAGFVQTGLFQSAVLYIEFVYLWSHLDTRLLIAKY